jgi:ribosomal-protein-alanine N-acetyltransferase
MNVRWMIRRDLPHVLEIEQLQFAAPWTEEQFIRSLRQWNIIGRVADGFPAAEDGYGTVQGFVIYELHKTRLHILDIAVHPSCQRRGVGRTIVEQLVKNLSPKGRTRIMLEIRETNVEAQLFFKAMGFRAISVLRDFYDDVAEDAVLMQYRLPAAVQA